MLIPILIQKGYSLDAYIWAELFVKRHENVTIRVSGRMVQPPEELTDEDNFSDEGFYELKVELEKLGVPIVRALFAYAHSDSNKAVIFVPHRFLTESVIWLKEAFQTEFVHESVPLLSKAQEMGMKFIRGDEHNEITTYYMDMLRRLSIAEEHYKLNTNAPRVSPDRYSVFTEAVKSLDFDSEIEGE